MSPKSWLVIAVTVVLLVVFLAVKKPRLGFQPKLTASWVGIQVDGEPLTRVGKVEIARGTDFLLRAVVEAVDRRGRTFYYTEAGRLEMFGQEVPVETLRLWDGGRTRVLWFTVEGSPPFAEFDWNAGEAPETFREVFQADWPFAWTVPGRLRPAVENYLPRDREARRGERFGTQRFQVRVEVLDPKSEIRTRQSLSSWGGAEVVSEVAHFPTVIVRIPGSLAQLSGVFGLPQREPGGADREAGLAATAAWLEEDLAFSQVGLLRSWLDSNNTSWDNLDWQVVEIGAEVPWGHSGDPLRAGDRIVWLLEDRGQAEFLDYDDLCLDFDRGATVATLGEVFGGTGVVELAHLEEN